MTLVFRSVDLCVTGSTAADSEPGKTTGRKPQIWDQHLGSVLATAGEKVITRTPHYGSSFPPQKTSASITQNFELVRPIRRRRDGASFPR